MRRLTLSFLFTVLLHASSFYGACGASHTSTSASVNVVDHYMTDNILHRRWAVTMDCNHPERPWGMEEVQWQNPMVANTARAIRLVEVVTASAPLVTKGARVQVWRTGAEASIQLRGVALESGEMGQRIHVRMQRPETVLEGKVSGEGLVELLASDRWKSQ